MPKVSIVLPPRDSHEMKVLIGEFSGKSKFMPKLKQHGWGRMWASYGPAFDYDDEPWGFDNGAWSAYTKKVSFDEAKFIRRLNRAIDRATYPPIVAVVPDIVGSGLASLAFSEGYLNGSHLVRGWPWFLAVQDGMCIERVRRVMLHYDIAGLFLGGTDEFKKTAPIWCELAHRNNKSFHFARCNREDWYRLAIRIGTDSMDSTRPLRAFTGGEMSRFKRFEQLVTGQCKQLPLMFPETQLD